MSVSTIIQNGYDLSCNIDELPSQYSNDIEFEFVCDDKYKEYTPTGYFKYLSNQFIESGVDSPTHLVNLIKADGNYKFKLPIEAFEQDGYLAIAFSLTFNREVIQTKALVYKIWASVGNSNILPTDKDVWQEVVFQAVDDYIEKNLRKGLEELMAEASSLQAEAKQQQIVAENIQAEAIRQQQVAREQQDKAEIQQHLTTQEQEKTNQLQTTVDQKIIKLNELENTVNSNETSRQFAEEVRQTNTTLAIDSCNEIVSQIQEMLERGEFDGEDSTIEIGKVIKGDVASVTNVGTVNHAIFDIVLPKGDKGNMPTLEINSVKTGTPKVEIHDSETGYILDITLPGAGDLSNYYDRDEINTKFSEKIVLEEKDGTLKNLNLKFTVTDELVVPNNEEIKVSPNMAIKIQNKKIIGG